jgi:hypothetical protein
LSITLDGAELCDGISHLTAGIKITDGRAIDPQTGVPLCTADDDTFGTIFTNQSRNFCFAIKSLIGKDSKKAYKEFKDIFKFFENVKKFGLPVSELGPAIMPMDVWSPQDLSSIWKCLNTGSDARENSNKHFCHLCACCGNDIVRYLVEENRYGLIIHVSINIITYLLSLIYFISFFRCDYYKENNKERCYHWSVRDEHSIEMFWRGLTDHLENYLRTSGRHYKEVKRCTRIIYDPTDLTASNNQYNVEYIPARDTDAQLQEAKIHFSNLLTAEL